ncbi:MAG: hypothetical protein ACK41T_12535, partial [Pseudobdellovibrio sp.]
HIYTWMVPDLVKILAPRTQDALEYQLIPYFTQDTIYSQIVFNRSDKPGAPMILAQYEYLDIMLHDLEMASLKHGKLSSVIKMHRQSIHKAAREMLLTLEAEIAHLSPEDKNILKQDFRYKLYKDYLSASKLSYKTLDEAIAKIGDDTVPLMRCSNVAACQYGYIPQTTMRSFIKKIPFNEKLLTLGTEINKDLETNEGRSKLANRVKNSRFLPKSVKEKLVYYIENKHETLQNGLYPFLNNLYMEPGSQTPISLAGDRKVFYLSNRAAGNDKDEGGLSFSTNPNLYFNGPVFAQGKQGEVGLKIVRAPRKTFTQNYTSGFASEYEVVVDRPIFNSAVVKSYTGEEMKQHLKAEDVSPKLKEFMKKYLGTDVSTEFLDYDGYGDFEGE